MFARDDVSAHWLRESTRLNDLGDMDGAIQCLETAKKSMLASEVSFPIETWTKLARYLVKAGRIEEARAELQWLLDDLPRRHTHQHRVDSAVSVQQRRERLRYVKESVAHSTQVIQVLMYKFSNAKYLKRMQSKGAQHGVADL